MAKRASKQEDLLETILDSKSMESLQEKIMAAIKPTLELIVSSLIAPFKEEILQLSQDMSSTLVADLLSPVIQKIQLLTVENSTLKHQINTMECQANRTSLAFSGFPEALGTGLHLDQQHIMVLLLFDSLATNWG